MTDRNVKFMQETWGTTSLVTDYSHPKKKMLREVSTEKFLDEKLNEETEIFDNWDYGLESFHAK
ncbi:hypothetical protein b3_0261 [Synechococcus phage B3]|jgi:hypothetical protein|nr:hypothetical protein b3_0261 [Synechococcus phage B3]QGT54868.1 hypothetical protein b23_0254 [Synechococcus phage B23]